MKERTRWIKKELDADLSKMRFRNNSKDEKRTDEQIEQSQNARADYYTRKWEGILNDADTEAQRKYCQIALKAAGKISNGFSG